jgi:pimeloyl-ACP methyl ester carboxylesterase
VIAGDATLDEVGRGIADLEPDLRERIESARRGDPAIAGVMADRLGWYAADPGRILRTADERLVATGENALIDDPDAGLRARPAVRQALETMFAEGARQGAEGFVEDWIATVVPWGFRFRDVAVPVDLWWGDRDPLTSTEDTETLARLLPAARLTVIPDAGHSVPITHWREILDGVLRRWTGPTERARD